MGDLPKTSLPSLKDAVQMRRTCRSFATWNSAPVPQNLIDELSSYAQNVTMGPLGHKLRFQVIKHNGGSGAMMQPFKEPGLWFVGVVAKSENDVEVSVASSGSSTISEKMFGVTSYDVHPLALVDYGFGMERLILEASRRQLATLWLGGSLNRETFGKLVSATENEHLCCVCPIGYVAPPSKGIFSKIFGSAADPNDPVTSPLDSIQISRKAPWEERIFESKFGSALTQEAAGVYADALEAMRMSPSGFNKQPAHVVFDRAAESFHFFMNPSSKYYTWIDVGIAMNHFYEVLSEGHPEITGTFRVLEQVPEANAPTEAKYICSWVRTKTD